MMYVVKSLSVQNAVAAACTRLVSVIWLMAQAYSAGSAEAAVTASARVVNRYKKIQTGI